MTTYTMTAKFDGTCSTCGGRIRAGQTIRWDKATRKASHLVGADCEGAQRQAEDARRAALAAALCSNPSEANRFAYAAQRATATAPTSAPALDLGPIARFIQAAKDRGLKFPKLRVLAPDGKTELTLGLTVAGFAPGSVSVKLAGEFVGTVTPDGTPRRLSPELQAHLVKVAAAPQQAAKAYAVLMCRCSFCGLALTDAGSVEVGYGPVCADHWGLPHTAKGTKAPAAVEAA